MCIRDRAVGMRTLAADKAIALGTVNKGGVGAQIKAAGLGPVSYTHLRAHETVLDLVCRLLLVHKK